MAIPTVTFDANECQELLDLIAKLLPRRIDMRTTCLSCGAEFEISHWPVAPGLDGLNGLEFMSTEEERAVYEKLRLAGSFYISEKRF